MFAFEIGPAVVGFLVVEHSCARMNTPALLSMGRGAGTAFGETFAAYSAAFGARDRDGLAAAFAPDARVTVRARRTGQPLDLSPAECEFD